MLRNGPRATQVRGIAANYRHEAALGGQAPAGTVYDPERDGKPLASLGVHEYWDTMANKQHSGNLGKRPGIELAKLPATPQGQVKTAPR